MKKYKEWLTNVIEIMESETSENYPHEQMVEREVVLNLINQLDEPEAKQIKELDSYNDELIRDNNQLRNALDSQKVLSQEWVDENSTNLPMSSPMTRWVPVSKLQNLLVPKQEVTEEQVMEWLDNNDFYDDRTAETVLGNAVDKGELGYYGTKYLVVEKPVIPKYVADWVEDLKSKEINLLTIYDFTHGEDINDYMREQSDTLMRAWLDGFTVGKEQKYYVLDSEDIPLLEKVNNYTYKTTTGLSIYEDGRDNSRFELTEQEIKDYDERYWAFVKKVEELEE